MRLLSPVTTLPALSYQYSSSLSPAIGATDAFLTLSVVTTSLPLTLVTGARTLMTASPCTGLANEGLAAGAAGCCASNVAPNETIHTTVSAHTAGAARFMGGLL